MPHLTHTTLRLTQQSTCSFYERNTRFARCEKDVISLAPGFGWRCHCETLSQQKGCAAIRRSRRFGVGLLLRACCDYLLTRHIHCYYSARDLDLGSWYSLYVRLAQFRTPPFHLQWWGIAIRIGERDWKGMFDQQCSFQIATPAGLRWQRRKVRR